MRTLEVALISILAVCFVLPSVTRAQPNLLTNPGFEANGGSFAGWMVPTAGTEISTPATDDIYRTGSAAAKLFGQFNGCPGSPTFDVSVAFQSFTPTPGLLYQFKGYSFVSSGDPIPGANTCNSNRLLAQVAFYDMAVGGSLMSRNEVILGDFDTATDVWIPFTVDAIAPSGALRVEVLLLFLQPGCDTGAVFVDDLSFREFEPAETPNVLTNPNLDGGLTGWTIFENVVYDASTCCARSPNGSAKLFSSFLLDMPSGMFQSFPTTAGTEWQFDVYSLNTCFLLDPVQNDNYAVARIVFRDGGGIEIAGTEVVIADANSALGTWTPFSVSATAPPNTAAVEAIILFISPTLQGGSIFVDDLAFYDVSTVDVGTEVGGSRVSLAQNVPNPFGSSTRIDFSLPRQDDVRISIYDVAGRWVTTLQQGTLPAGAHRVTWDGRRADGSAAAPGLYRYVLRTRAESLSRSLLLLP